MEIFKTVSWAPGYRVITGVLDVGYHLESPQVVIGVHDDGYHSSSSLARRTRDCISALLFIGPLAMLIDVSDAVKLYLFIRH